MTKFIRVAALVLLFFNGVSAVFGGLGLMIDPSGKMMQIPIDFLRHSPFSDFLIPGIILFTFNGIFSFIIAVLTILKVKNYAWLIILEGCILTGWLTVQIIFIKMFYPPFHVPYYLTGFFLMITGLFLVKVTD